MAEPDSEENEVEDEGGEDWLGTYADAITLLMAFFVILLARSQGGLPTNQEQAEQAAEQAAVQQEAKESGEVLQAMKEAIESTAQEHSLNKSIHVTSDDESVTIEMTDKGFFPTGSWRLKPRARRVLRSLARVVQDTPFKHPYQLEIQGHTDDVPIRKRGIHSNWDLSSRRATNVLRVLVNGGMDQERLKAVGYAHTRPKMPNRNAYGKPLPANRAANRRVVLLLELQIQCTQVLSLSR